MGGFSSKGVDFIQKFYKKKKKNVHIIGLDNGGKTTILYQISKGNINSILTERDLAIE